MESVIEHLKNRVAESEREYQETVKKRIELLELEHKLQREVEAYKLALQGELRRDGAPQVAEHAEPEDAVEAFELRTGQPQSVKSVIAARIREAGPGGTTRKYIAQYLESRGVEAHRNYHYVVVAALKSEGKVKEVDGRLIWQE